MDGGGGEGGGTVMTIPLPSALTAEPGGQLGGLDSSVVLSPLKLRRLHVGEMFGVGWITWLTKANLVNMELFESSIAVVNKTTILTKCSPCYLSTL